MKLRFFFFILVLGVLTYYFFSPKSPKTDKSEFNNDSFVETSENKNNQVSESNTNTEINLKKSEKATEETKINSAEIVHENNFIFVLNSIQSCLDIKNNINVSSKPQLKIDYLLSSLKSEWGEAIVLSEDEKIIEHELKNGEIRVLKIEMGESGENLETKYFMFEKKNGQINPLAMSIDPETEATPNNIQSMLGDSKVINYTRKDRYFFSEGQEVSAVIENDILSQVTVSHGGKSLHCELLLDDKKNCSCN